MRCLGCWASVYLAELERQIKKNKAGIELYNGMSLDMLMYADDVVLISSSAAGLQTHLTTLTDFCQKKKLEVSGGSSIGHKGHVPPLFPAESHCA